MRLRRVGQRVRDTLTRPLVAGQSELLEQQRRMLGEIAALRAELATTSSRVEFANTRLADMDRRALESEALLRGSLQILVDDEPRARERVLDLRASPEYAAAWTDAEPLVSIVIPTYVHWQTLESRAIPSALAQTYPNVEVVVVGDAASAEVGASVARVSDPRVRYENLSIRGPYPEDARQRWFVAGTGPMNRAMELARGRWIAFLNDDDAMCPDHIEALLGEARRTSAEVVYSKLLMHRPDNEKSTIAGTFPPSNHGFAWQLAMHHNGLRFFEYQLGAALFDEPGDWHRARRMMRAGVRFAQIDRVTIDYYPSKLWYAEE